MKIIYFDCQAGAAGNMILGALIDAGLDPDLLKKELNKIPSSKSQAPNKSQITSYKLQIKKTRRDGIQGTQLEVKLKDKEPQRNLKDIVRIITKSNLSKNIKQKSIAIFNRLALAEAKVHGVSIDKIHFHEVGAIDAIIDIVGTVIALEKLGIEEVYCSPIPHGKGFIKHHHGVLPIPAPATAELLKGVPTYQTDIKGELITPTAAAIISSLCQNFDNLPRLKIASIGYGQGTKYYGIPNFLRVFIGETSLPYKQDTVLQMETNIDDLKPEEYHSIIAKLMKAGALDAYIVPILMKKKRKADQLVVLCKPKDKAKLLDLIFTLTTTIGIRLQLVKRETLKREVLQIGKNKLKVAKAGKTVKNIKSE